MFSKICNVRIELVRWLLDVADANMLVQLIKTSTSKCALAFSVCFDFGLHVYVVCRIWMLDKSCKKLSLQV